MLARHPRLAPHGKRRSFKPDFIVNTVTDIDFDYLHKHGIKAALIDLDGTVVARGTYDVAAATSKHLKQAALKIYIATNRPKSRSLKDLKDRLNANGVIHPHGILGKPFPQYYAQAARDHGLKPEECVMIGDRFLQDIFGANAAGLTTIAVKKLDRPTNSVDRLLSGAERRFIVRLSRIYKPLNH